MPVTIEQTWDGSQIAGQMYDGTIESEYIVRGTNDEFVAWTNLEAATALVVGALVKQDVNIDRRLGEFEWAGSVRWGMRERPDTNDSSFSFDTSGGNQHITQALQTVGLYAPVGKTAADYKGAIGVTDNGVEGVDITIPVYNFEETHYLPVAFVDAAYKLTVFSLTGKVNSLAFKGFAPGECLFLGASGSLRKHDQWEVTYKFSASPNVSGLTMGGITGIAKDGWDYLWVRYVDQEDGAAKKLVRRPEAVYVERVYGRADLNTLGI
ncbi:MAG: hypothetical protein ACE5KM_17125 [Planctomycetaceae bacterium]